MEEIKRLGTNEEVSKTLMTWGLGRIASTLASEEKKEILGKFTGFKVIQKKGLDDKPCFICAYHLFVVLMSPQEGKFKLI